MSEQTHLFTLNMHKRENLLIGHLNVHFRVKHPFETDNIMN